eukprot:m.35526 g.35526  ORF g.35526 m.35526 type:complete len:295 (+) comp7451_c0_seq1:210-1094(+)
MLRRARGCRMAAPARVFSRVQQSWTGLPVAACLSWFARVGRSSTRQSHSAPTPPAASAAQASWESPGRHKSSVSGTTAAQRRGEIQLIMGPMFAGKSTELVRRLKRYMYANLNCVVLKHNIDHRFTDREAEVGYLSTHDNVNVMQAHRVHRLRDAKTVLEDADVIGIDEGQFFDDLVPFCDEAAEEGKVVIVSALDGTFLRTPFGSVGELIPKCESVVKLTAVCAECGDSAPFSARLVADSTTTLIGGRDEYAPMCRRHWREPPTTGSQTKTSDGCSTKPSRIVVSDHVVEGIY